MSPPRSAVALSTVLLTLAWLVPPALGAQSEERYFVVGFDELPKATGSGDSLFGAEVVRVDGTLDFARVLTSDPNDFLARAAEDNRVRYVEPDPVIKMIEALPDDPGFVNQYGPQQVRAPEAWDTTFGDADSSVCVVDTGVRYTHEDLAGSRWMGGRDFVNGDNDPMDDNGHGTHVAGIAAASSNNLTGIAGIANVRVYGVKVLNAAGHGSWSAVASGIRWCADNAGPRTVINLSLGAGGGATELQDAVIYAHSHGALLVAAAGNGGPCTNCVIYPAAYPEVIAVTCTTPSEAQCGFSSDGPQSEIAAPGQAILSSWHTSDSAYNTISGTSMSSPHVAGVAALVWSDATSLGNAELRTRLRASVKDLGPAGWDEQFGYGLVDAKAALDLPIPSVTQIYLENFDDGSANGWTLGGLWHVSAACATAPSPLNYLAYNQDSDCEYSTGARTTGSATFAIDLSGRTAATLGFLHRFEKENYAADSRDLMQVQVSTNGGSSYTTLKQWSSRNADQLDWLSHAIDLTPYSGQPIKLRFKFDSVKPDANNFDGWFLDDVEVTANVGDLPNQPPVANAGVDQIVADADASTIESVSLDGSASSDVDGTITSYEWRETGAVVATGATPTIDLGLGTHTLTLTVTDDEGDTSSDDVLISIAPNSAPTASFTHTTSGDTLSVDASASTDPDGSIASYSWDWGDGTPLDSGAIASHTFASPGSYVINLTVVDNGGSPASTSQTVSVGELPNQPPVADSGADQTVSDDDASSTETVSLNGSASSDLDGTITSYEWREAGALVATGPTPILDLAVGSHTITLTVTDNESDVASDDVVITVTPNATPTASFTYATDGTNISVDGSSSTDPDGSIASYSWDWGDGTPQDSGAIASHTFASLGSYVITLTVVDNGGSPASTSKTVAVGEAPPLFFENFDDGSANGWTLGGLWHVSAACATAPSPLNYLAYNKDSTCDYATGSRTTGNATFAVDLTGSTSASLKFLHRFEKENYSADSRDLMQVQVSTNGGSTFTTLKQWSSRNADQLDWLAHAIDLTPYSGQPIKLRFRFDSVKPDANNFDGWFLDDVKVTGS